MNWGALSFLFKRDARVWSVRFSCAHCHWQDEDIYSYVGRDPGELRSKRNVQHICGRAMQVEVLGEVVTPGMLKVGRYGIG